MRRVLIIEDDVWQADHTASVLQAADFQTHQVHDALDGIDAIDSFLPDVIMLDILLPGPNGITLLNELQSHEDTAEIPVVILSTHGDIPTKTLAAYGIRAVLDKTTVTDQQILSAVTRAIA